MPAIFASGFFHGDTELIQETTVEFVKILIYFVLLIALVTDVAHIRADFLRWICIFSAAVTLIAVLRYHADLEGPPPVRKHNPGNQKTTHGTYVVDEVARSANGPARQGQSHVRHGHLQRPQRFLAHPRHRNPDVPVLADRPG